MFDWPGYSVSSGITTVSTLGTPVQILPANNHRVVFAFGNTPNVSPALIFGNQAIPNTPYGTVEPATGVFCGPFGVNQSRVLLFRKWGPVMQQPVYALTNILCQFYWTEISTTGNACELMPPSMRYSSYWYEAVNFRSDFLIPPFRVMPGRPDRVMYGCNLLGGAPLQTWFTGPNPSTGPVVAWFNSGIDPVVRDNFGPMLDLPIWCQGFGSGSYQFNAFSVYGVR